MLCRRLGFIESVWEDLCIFERYRLQRRGIVGGWEWDGDSAAATEYLLCWVIRPRGDLIRLYRV